MIEPTEKQLTVLNKMSELEESIGRLYQAYAALFPDYQQFWLGLANEEKQHAEWIRKFHSYIAQGSATFSENRFNATAIQTFLNYLKEELGKVSGQGMSLINALSITLYIEESLMENKYFAVIDGDSHELKKTLSNLASATQNHINRVHEAFNKYKRSAI